MPIKLLPQLTAWSFSRLMTWESCPLKCKLANIDRIREPARDVLVRGQNIETELLAYITKQSKTCPESGARFKTELTDLRKIARKIVTKKRFAFDSNWQLLDDYFAPNVWLRCEFDLFWEEEAGEKRKYWRVHSVDLKSGRVYEDKVCQVELYNLVALILPEGVLANTPSAAFSELWYLDQGETRDAALLSTEVEKAKDTWMDRVRPMMADTSFEPKPSHLCRWCFYRKGNKKEGGGQCPF